MLWKIILLGFIQGIAEFLPISSTAHLVLAEKFLGLSEDSFGLTFDIALHLGTTLALMICFWSVWKNLINTTINLLTNHRKVDSNDRKLLVNLIIATLPAVLIGLLFEKEVAIIFRSPFWIAFFMILFSLVFLIAEAVSKKKKELKNMGTMEALIIGLNQAVALLPGVSRSGITLSAGLLLNYRREEAGNFAFMLSLPVVLGALFKHSVQIGNHLQSANNNLFYFFIGIVISFVVGLWAIKLFLSYLKKHSLIPFIIYRLVLAVFIFWLLLSK